MSRQAPHERVEAALEGTGRKTLDDFLERVERAQVPLAVGDRYVPPSPPREPRIPILRGGLTPDGPREPTWEEIAQEYRWRVRAMKNGN